MRIIRYNENMLDACAEFWWSIYEDMPYAHRPDGYPVVNTPSVGPQYFVEFLEEALSGAHTGHWGGEVTNDSIVLAIEEEKVEGILVSSIDREKLTGNILSAYMQRNHRGREIAGHLLTEALEHFGKMGLHRAVAAPGKGRSMEVECPIHLALLDAGFAWGIWENDWQPVCVGEQYGVFLGGWLEGFRVQPEIKEKVEKLRQESISIERVPAHEFCNLRRLDTGEKFGADWAPATEVDWEPVTFVALVDGYAVGWLQMGLDTSETEAPGAVAGEVIPSVLPSYQRRGIGKVLYHLGIEELVRQGMRCGLTATGIYNSARLIYQSIGYRYWYTCFSRMTKRLR